jgi:malate synthase
MGVPFMQAYTDLLVQSCHKRGAHAIGGKAAFIPNRHDPEVTENALQKVRQDKSRESTAGFDGTWVAHPDLVPVAREIFRERLQGRPNQKNCLREDVRVTAEQLTDFTIPNGTISEDGLRTNLNVALLYLEAWLQGTGAAALYNLMEDTATAEISRAQLWQWINHPEAKLEDGRAITLPLCRQLLAQEQDKIKATLGPEKYRNGRFKTAARLLDELISAPTFTEFLTLPGYEFLA